MTRRPLDGVWPISCNDACHKARGSAGGTDYAVPVDTPVFAPFAGNLQQGRNSIAGLYCSVRRADGATFYAMDLMTVVTSGAVQEGQHIAYSGGLRGPGSTSTGPHLHAHVVTNGVTLGFEEWYARQPQTAPTDTASTLINEEEIMERSLLIRNSAGEISYLDKATGKRRVLRSAEWDAFHANGTGFVQVTDAEYNDIPVA